MTLFGAAIDGQQLFGLISLLVMLAFWVLVFRRERSALGGFRKWEADRKARREAEQNQAGPDGPRRGPWG